MKAIMYHYVRPTERALPHFRYLHLDSFAAQLGHFEEQFGFVSRRDFEASLESGRPPCGVVLTFDDGLKDHVRHVAPLLRRLGLWGVFYVPSGPHQTGRLLDVHRIHLLLGSRGGVPALAALRRLLRPETLSEASRAELAGLTYEGQDDEPATKTVKRILNYVIDYRDRATTIDRLCGELGLEVPSVEDFYLTPDEIRSLRDEGHVVGSHSVTHRLLSKLSVAEQRQELEESFHFLEEATGGLPYRTFCYPYGGFHSFTEETERLLGELDCRFSFNVEQRDIQASDLSGRPQALPRYDCNRFAHGAAAKGASVP